MRLFLALEVPEAVREAVWARVAACGVDRSDARWVRPAGLHLTLHFLGEVVDSIAPRLIASSAAAAATCDRFEAGLEGGGWFPRHGAARALWVGLRADPALERLQARLADAAGSVPGAVSAVSMANRSRPFHAHLTLARCAPHWPRARAEAFVASLGSFAELSFPVSEAVLMRSHPGPGGSRYEVLARFALALGAAGLA